MRGRRWGWAALAVAFALVTWMASCGPDVVFAQEPPVTHQVLRAKYEALTRELMTAQGQQARDLDRELDRIADELTDLNRAEIAGRTAVWAAGIQAWARVWTEAGARRPDTGKFFRKRYRRPGDLRPSTGAGCHLRNFPM